MYDLKLYTLNTWVTSLCVNHYLARAARLPRGLYVLLALVAFLFIFNESLETCFKGRIGKIGLFTFIRRLGIPKRSVISQSWFQKVQWRWSGYIVWTFDELWSVWCSNCRVYEGERRTPPRRSAL